MDEEEDIDLNFRCVPGDLIFVREIVLRHSDNNAPLSRSTDGYFMLGADVYDENIDQNDASLVLCTVIARVESEIASNLNYLVLMTSSGELMYVFDDPQNGYWVPAGNRDGDKDDEVVLRYCTYDIVANLHRVLKLASVAWHTREMWQSEYGYTCRKPAMRETCK